MFYTVAARRFTDGAKVTFTIEADNMTEALRVAQESANKVLEYSFGHEPTIEVKTAPKGTTEADIL